MFRTPHFLNPSELSNRYAREGRYNQYPGPFEIGEGWQHDLERIFPGIMNIPYDPIMPMYGGLGHSELEFLCRLVSWMEPEVVVELGTSTGRTTRMLAEKSPENCRVLTVDLPPDFDIKKLPYSTDAPFAVVSRGRVGEEYRGSSQAGKITQFHMDATTDEFRRELDKWLNGRKIDLSLVDAAHDFYTTRDLCELIYLRLSYGGITVCDDFGRIGRLVGVTEYFANAARQTGRVFFHFNPSPPIKYEFNNPNPPKGDEQTMIFFINLTESIRGDRPWER